MAKYFTFAEMVASEVAIERGIDNTPDWQSIDNLRNLVEHILEKVRALWGKPIYVNSGYRSEALNRAVGGEHNSQHLKGMASDITTGSIEGNKRLFALIEESELPFDQLIDEKGYKWLHISYDPLKAIPRRETLHL